MKLHSNLSIFALVPIFLMPAQAQFEKKEATVRVTVTGEMVKPGSCEIPYVFDPQDLKKVCGGPTEFGDLSNIVIIRFSRIEGLKSNWKLLPVKDEIIRVADAKKGTKITLYFGDVIYIPAKKIGV